MDLSDLVSNVNLEEVPVPDKVEEPTLSQFESLPNELLLKLFSYIEASDLVSNVSQTCQRFKWILDEEYWKFRFHNYFDIKKGIVPYPPIERTFSNECFWTQSCRGFENQLTFWTETAKMDERNAFELKSLKAIEFQTEDSSCINAVHFFGNGQFLASGNRSGYLTIMNLENLKSEAESSRQDLQVRDFTCIFNEDQKSVKDLYFEQWPQSNLSLLTPTAGQKGHRGWLWRITSNSKGLFTGGWDGIIKMWDFDGFCSSTEFNIFKASAGPCISLSCNQDENLIFCGSFHSKIFGFDIRTPDREVFISNGAHKRSVLAIKCLSETPNLIVSASEDGRIGLTDIRNCSETNEFVKSFKIPNFPTCISFNESSNFFYAGDVKGGIHLIDLHNFNLLETYAEVGEGSPKIREIYQSFGSIITCTSNGMMNVYEPSRNLQKMASFQIYPNLDLTSMDSQNNQFGIGGSDGKIRIFI